MHDRAANTLMKATTVAALVALSVSTRMRSVGSRRLTPQEGNRLPWNKGAGFVRDLDRHGRSIARHAETNRDLYSICVALGFANGRQLNTNLVWQRHVVCYVKEKSGHRAGAPFIAEIAQTKTRIHESVL